MQGAVFGDQYFDAGKGAAPYYAVVEMRVNADDSVKWVRIYQSSGNAEYDQDALLMARTLLTMPEVAHCKHIESDFFYVHYPHGYTKPEFTPHLSGAVASPSPSARPLTINWPGTFHDKATWEYRTADNKYTTGATIDGTNETLVMPSPSPPAGGTLHAVVIARHRFDTLGYPLHIALVEKLFAASYQTTVYVYDGHLWSHDYGQSVADERSASGGSRPAFKVFGPYHADAVPLAQAPEPEIQAAFDFAKGALNSIGNMPQVQKDLANYGVLFLDDGNIVWVEFGPRFAPGEAPHLGCQTELGRDIVFGYNKKQPDHGKSGKFLQCF